MKDRKLYETPEMTTINLPEDVILTSNDQETNEDGNLLSGWGN